jgi:hypothetical protein
MQSLNSIEAMRMFGVVADHIGAKPDRKSISERVMDFVDALHESGFIIVPNRAPGADLLGD